ncbi:MAG TPA: CsiV family protein [Steroidobacteraceae bacterium]|nr:CsiV family protein [Steroidobacteraceae bacterium]
MSTPFTLLARLAADDFRGATARAHAPRLVRLVVLVLSVAAVIVGLKASAAEPARVQETAYNVELVIFRQLTPLGVAEDWSVEGLKGRPVAAASEDEAGGMAVGAAGSPLAVNALSPALFKLTAMESSLQRSRGYEVVGHIGWTQIAVPRGSGLAVELSEVGLNGVSVRGTGALERGKYLYLRLNLAYSPADPPASLVGTVQSDRAVTFSLNQVRRVRPFERHYFDHPAFGVIAMISPVS